MPISYVIDPQSKIVRTESKGAIKVSEIVNHLASLKRDQLVQHRELIDVSGVTPPYLTSSEIWQAAQAVMAIVLESKPSPRALFVTHEVVYGMCRMFATLVEDTFPIRVFRNLEAAEHWLLEEHQLDAESEPVAAGEMTNDE